MDAKLPHWTLLSILLLAVPHAVAAELYRWVDENGNVYYSDQVPPSQAKRPRVELNAYGQAIKEVNTYKTRKQRLRERQARLEALERQRRKERREAEDRALLSTFSSVAEIEAIYANRLQDIDNYTAANRRKLAKARKLLEKTIAKKEWYESENRKVPRQIEQNIKEYEQQIATYELLIQRNLAKRDTLQQRFVQDKQRYLLLTTSDDTGQ